MTRKGPGQVIMGPQQPRPRPQQRIPSAPPRAPRPPQINPGPPYVEVERADRWTWTVRLFHGISAQGYRRVWGTRTRADRVAGRLLARYLREEQRSASTAHRVIL